MTVKIINADVMEGLRLLPDESVHMVCTSPPYYGLRDYGVDGQIGLEATPAAFVQRLVDVFRDVRRVLRSDGTCWLNMGDSYNAAGRVGHGTRVGYKQNTSRASASKTDHVRPSDAGLKEKDLLLIPERLAIALQDDGWYIRSRIIWHKPNPMPESVTDRPTKSHEHIWLMSKAPRYFYDAESIKEPATQDEFRPSFRGGSYVGNNAHDNSGNARSTDIGNIRLDNATRNARDVWTIATAPFAEAHFATFPPELAERCIKAGTSEKGCCAKCGAPWVRQVERETVNRSNAAKAGTTIIGKGHVSSQVREGHDIRNGPTAVTTTLGWTPSCACKASVTSCAVLDPFGGSGTTGLVADRLQRNAILIELNPTYADMAKRRLSGDAPLFAEVSS